MLTQARPHAAGGALKVGQGLTVTHSSLRAARAAGPPAPLNINRMVPYRRLTARGSPGGGSGSAYASGAGYHRPGGAYKKPPGPGMRSGSDPAIPARIGLVKRGPDLQFPLTRSVPIASIPADGYY